MSEQCPTDSTLNIDVRATKAQSILNPLDQVDQVALEKSDDKERVKDDDANEPVNALAPELGMVTLQEWFHKIRAVKSCPASECGSPDVDTTEGSPSITPEPEPFSESTPDTSPTAFGAMPCYEFPEEKTRTKLSSNAVPFQPGSSQTSAEGSSSWIAVPVRLWNPQPTWNSYGWNHYGHGNTTYPSYFYRTGGNTGNTFY